MPANPVLEGLASFNQSVGQLAQQRALSQATDYVNQINQSELSTQKKQQALQQYGQQFALQAQALGMDPSTALANGKMIGPPQPLIQSPTEAAIYGTPEQQTAVNTALDSQNDRAVKVRRAEDDYNLARQNQLLTHQVNLAKLNNGSRELQTQMKVVQAQHKANESEVDKLNGALRKGKDFDALQAITSAINGAPDFLANPSPYKDNLIITALAKAADPTTGVKQQEFNEYANAAGLPTRMEGLMQRLQNGERLTPDQRTGALDALRQLHGSVKATYDSRVKPIHRRIMNIPGGSVDDPFEALNASGAVSAGTPSPMSATSGGSASAPQQQQLQFIKGPINFSQ